MIFLKEGKSSKKGIVKYWHAYAGTNRIGYVYISQSTNEPLGKHHSINVFINKAFQRKGYGTEVFKQASLLSGYPVLYAHSSKSNVGSYRAALKAGYKEIAGEDFRQRVMKWKK